MKKTSLQENLVYVFLCLIRDFFTSLIASIALFVRSLLGKKAPPLKENVFLDSMNFFLHIGPKSFWKAPSGIKIGRSASTFLHYVFRKKESFQERAHTK